ncbi:S-methylmethionine--homocysteine S-methyltransferase BHMT2-like [Saccostrea echinata]|uniref:S-methylmethionine--homocysteine S-methyltransferase BHMT2-like n=1 Tax=Saccostrea echinata TaxID=191078 RepID=UPI002A814064|nr:S-methylmethionine--homocysteine S-methyltransferase BHMT2-like [Saccostrea echinata]
MTVEGLLERLQKKKDIVVAEGYIFEFERRGYLRAGCFVPEVVLNHPELVRSLYEEFVHAGSEVVLAFTYYGHREKLKLIDREDDVKELNIKALKIAKEVAINTGTLMAGNICNTTVFERGNQEAIDTTRKMFKEQIEWAVECGADYIVAETFSEYAEAELALQCIKQYGRGLPSVVSLVPHGKDITSDGLTFPEACKKLEEAGADVVGLNCCRGPKTMMPLIKDIRKACKGPICMLPVPYRTTPEQPTMQTLRDAESGKTAFPFDLPAFACSRTQVAEFAREAKEVGVQYIGLCCGNTAHYIRVVAEEYGRRPPASKFSPDMSEHYIFGDKKHVKSYHATNLLPDM